MLFGIRWGSLRTKIIAWSFVPTMIILVIVAVVIFYAYQDVTEDLVIERNRDLTRLVADQFRAGLKEHADLLNAEARTPDIYENDPAAQRDALKGASNRLAVFDAGVLILDTFGTVVAVEPERPEVLGRDWSHHTYYREILRSQMRGSPEPVFSDIVADGRGGSEVIVVAVPIIGPRGEFVGAIAGMFRVGATNVSAFYGGVVRLRLGEIDSAYLVDGQGRVIYDADSDRIGDDYSAQPVVQQVLTGEVGAFRTRDLDGREIVASFAPVPGTPWGLVVEESWATLTSGSRGYGQFLLLLLGLGVTVPIIVVAVGVRRITKPIVELIGAAQEVAKGSFGPTITARTGDEVEELAKQFNLMSAQLQESYTYLEQRVADRTEELEALNAIAAVVSRSLDLQEILEDALVKTLEVTGLEAGGIYLLQDKVLTIVAHKGLDRKLVGEIDNLKVGEGFSGRVVQTCEPMVVRNLSTDPRLTRSAVREAGFESVAIVPLVSRRKVLGSLFGITRGDREFAQQDIELLASIGHQIGVAVENARLFNAEQRRAEQFRVIGEVGRDITSILVVDELLNQMTRLIKEALEFYLVGIALIEGDELVFKAGAGAVWEIPGFEPPRIKVGQEGITGWVAGSGEPLLVPDVSQEPRYYGLPETSEMQSELAVPLKTKGRVIGVLHAQSDRLNAFDESDLVVLQSLANQAAIAIENAQLFNAEQRRAEQFRVISEMGRHITSILDVDELLEEIIHLLRKAFGYYLITIGLIEGDEVVFKAGVKTHWADPRFRPPPTKVGGRGITAWVAATGEPLLAPDVSQEPRFLFLPDAAETRSELAVPLKTKTGVIGVLNVESDQLNAFDESDLAVLQSLAHQAAVAIENARLFHDTARQVRELHALADASRIISSELDQDQLLQAIYEQVTRIAPTDFCLIALYDEATNVVSIEINVDAGVHYPKEQYVLDEGLLRLIIHDRQPLLFDSMMEEKHKLGVEIVPSGSPKVNRGWLGVPMLYGDKVMGAIIVGSYQRGVFDEGHQQTLTSIANQAAVALENARLYEQARQLAVLEERNRLARDLHDSVTQALYGVTLYGEAAARQLSSGEVDLAADHLHELRDTAQEALREMRLLIFELRPPVLQKEGLVGALQARLEAVEGRAGLKTEFRVEVDEERLPVDIEEGLYRIAQEALNNALRHAQAQSIRVSLRQNQQTIILEVADDGVGFDPSTAVEYGGLGLDGMEERTEQLGGRLTMESKPGEGAIIRVEVNR